MIRRYANPILLLPMLVCLATPALAQSSAKSSSRSGPGIGWRGWGVRVGASQNPDQIYGGVHFDLGEFAKDVRFRPYFEIGSGDHVTTLQAMAEVTYLFSKVQVWKPYVGGSLGFDYVTLNDVPSGVDDTDTGIALMGIGGIETKLKSGTKFFAELKIGFADDDADAKVGVGWTWK
jgi:hypothetical protein